jgi:dTDP-4-amino-4,6-dideoxygalactose transaminase
VQSERSVFIPFARPTIDKPELEEVLDALQSGWISTGPKVKQFEADIADHVGAANAVAVSSCTDGLHLSLRALGIGPGDEVIVPTLTFCSSANVVEHVGARPVLADVGDDFNVTADSLAAAITDRTRAIMPVHFAGQSVDLDSIYRLAVDHDLAVVEDAAHAIGSSYGPHRIGADALTNAFPGLRRAVVFSFYATKNMTTGEGGMVVTDDAELASQLRLLGLHGMSTDAWKRYTKAGSWAYEVVVPGFKANMTDIQAALGIHQLQRLDRFIETRSRLADLYDQAFTDLPGVDVPIRLGGRSHTFHLYVLRLRVDELTIDRDQFIDRLADHGVGTSVHFRPVHMHRYYAETYGYQPSDLPNAARLFEQIVSIPIYPTLSEGDLARVVTAVESSLETG